MESDLLVLDTLDAVEVSLPIAGIGSRAYAFIIDWHIRLIAAIAWGFGVLLLLKYIGRGDEVARILLTGLPAMVIYFGYHPVLETLRGGRTPGKRMAGIRVLKQDGSIAGFGAHLARNLFRILDALPLFYALGLIVMFSNGRARRIGDLAAGTIMVIQADTKVGAIERLAASPLSPQLTLLIDELLQRWKQLEPESRRKLARSLLERGEATLPAEAGDNDLRAALKRLCGG